jgi:hypothetical protein
VHEFVYHCRQCDDLITYDTQCDIEELKTQLGKSIISDAEMHTYLPIIAQKRKKKADLISLITNVVLCAIAALLIINYIR